MTRKKKNRKKSKSQKIRDRTSELQDTARQLMIYTMSSVAIEPNDSLDPRTLLELQRMGIVKKSEDSLEDIDLEVLKNSDNPRRLAVPPGPLLPYRTAGKESHLAVIEIPTLVYSTSLQIRKMGIEILETMIKKKTLDALPRSIAILQKHRSDLLSLDPEQWRAAAIAVIDVLNEDFLIALQGLKQSLSCKPPIQEYVAIYFPKVMEPKVEILRWITLYLKKPEREHEKLTDIISRLMGSAISLTDLCSKYLQHLGYIPLAPPFCLSDLVADWLKLQPQTNAWDEIWQWVGDSPGPLPHYHACTVFIRNPTLIPEGKLPELWDAILRVLQSSGNPDESLYFQEAFALRRDLARHFAFHLEANLPDRDGAEVDYFAWWLAEQVSKIFPNDAKAIQFYREKWVAPALQRAAHQWTLSGSRIIPSVIRAMTDSLPFPWAVSLFCLMGGNLNKLLPAEQKEEIREKFHQAIVAGLLTSLPLPAFPPSNPTYAPELSMRETVVQWMNYQNDERREGLKILIESGQRLSSNEVLMYKLDRLKDSSIDDQFGFGIALRKKAFADETIAEPFWNFLTNAESRSTLFLKTPLHSLEQILDSVAVIQANQQDQWFSHLPHYVAEFCEITDDDERKILLFHFLIRLCLTSESTSALKRLLKGEHREKFLPLAEQYREKVLKVWQIYTPWVRAKLGPILLALES